MLSLQVDVEGAGELLCQPLMVTASLARDWAWVGVSKIERVVPTKKESIGEPG